MILSFSPSAIELIPSFTLECRALSILMYFSVYYFAAIKIKLGKYYCKSITIGPVLIARI